MKKIVGFLILLLFSSCVEKQSVQEGFVFTSSGAIKVKSLKFVNDTVFTTYNHYFDSQSDIYYYLLNGTEIDKINFYLHAVKNKDYQTEYINNNAKDGFEYQFEFLDNKERIYVYNIDNEEIQLLNDFSEYLLQIDGFKEEILYHKKSNIDFGDLNQFYPPEPEIDSILLHQEDILFPQ